MPKFILFLPLVKEASGTSGISIKAVCQFHPLNPLWWKGEDEEEKRRKQAEKSAAVQIKQTQL